MVAGSSNSRIRIGTAGWSLSAAAAERFPGAGSHLERYAAHFNAAEINSSFHRSHRRATYERWAASVPPTFRFAVKLPKTISHACRLVDCEDRLARFAEEIAGLGDKRGPVLVQLPPSFAFDESLAATFFDQARTALGGTIVCEPRHPSWFAPEPDSLLAAQRVARVAADPARVPAAAEPGGWSGLRYTRLHGSPHMYRSSYDEAAIARYAAAACGSDVENWTMYDNTTAGAALFNAVDMLDRVTAGRG